MRRHTILLCFWLMDYFGAQILSEIFPNYSLVINIAGFCIAASLLVIFAFPEIKAWTSGRMSFKEGAKQFVKIPATKTWISKREALNIIRNSAVVMKNSPRRKQKAQTVIDAISESAFSNIKVAPSGEEIYQNMYERDAAKGFLYRIEAGDLPVKRTDNKYSKEIIEYVLAIYASTGNI